VAPGRVIQNPLDREELLDPVQDSPEGLALKSTNAASRKINVPLVRPIANAVFWFRMW
jgi:hypothetical protein